MEDHIHIENVYPYNGDWPIDPAAFNNEDLHTIKDISGVRANELDAAFEAGDNDLVVAFAEIALIKAGLRVNRKVLWQAPLGSITLVVGDEEEAEDGPPASAPPNEQDSNGNAGSKPSSSGPSSTNGGDHPAKTQSPTGTPV